MKGVESTMKIVTLAQQISKVNAMVGDASECQNREASARTHVSRGRYGYGQFSSNFSNSDYCKSRGK